MEQTKLKILLGKPGLDGHDVGVKVLAHALIDSGFEVVYTGLRKSIYEIVQMAIDNQADMIGLSVLSGAHIILCQQMQQALQKANLSIPWMVGGNIPDSDVEALKALGAAAAFPTGTTIKEVVSYCEKLV